MNSPLWIAAKGGHYDVVKELLENKNDKANIYAQAEDGSLPLWAAKKALLSAEKADKVKI